MKKRIQQGVGTPSRRAFIVGTILTATAGATYAATPRRAEHRLAKVKLGDLISPRIGDWKFATRAGVVVPSDEGPIDGYDQVVTRVYEAEGLPSIMLLLAYGSTQGGSLQLHRPETCYPGQGFGISGFREENLMFGTPSIVHARSFTARRDERSERLLYWTRISDTFPRNTAEEYRAIIGSVLKGVIPDGILVRISTIGTDVAQMDKALAVFADALVKTSATGGRQILVGSAMTTALAKSDASHKI